MSAIWKEVRDENLIVDYVELTPEERAALPANWRTRSVNGYIVAFTADQMAERDAEEAQWIADAPKRALIAAEQESGMDRGERELAIRFLPPQSERRQRAEKAETEIAALGMRK